MHVKIKMELWDIETVFLYDGGNNFIARINEYQFHDVRVQIKEQQLGGYYVISSKEANNEPIRIDKDGRLEWWGNDPIFSTIENSLMKLI